MNIKTGAGDCTVYYFPLLTLPSLAHHSSVRSDVGSRDTVACLGLTNEIRRWQWHGGRGKMISKTAGGGEGVGGGGGLERGCSQPFTWVTVALFALMSCCTALPLFLSGMKSASSSFKIATVRCKEPISLVPYFGKHTRRQIRKRENKHHFWYSPTDR